jgi:SPOR domain
MGAVRGRRRRRRKSCRGTRTGHRREPTAGRARFRWKSGTSNFGPSGIFAVVSSTHARDLAEQIAVEVRAKGAAYLGGKRVNVQETDIPGKGIFYRVLIEPSLGRSEATKICNKLKSLGFVDCFLVAQP